MLSVRPLCRADSFFAGEEGDRLTSTGIPGSHQFVESAGYGRPAGLLHVLVIFCWLPNTGRRTYLSLMLAWLASISYAQAAGPVVVLIGLPGSGRSAQAAALKSRRSMTVISADDLIARNPEAFEKSRISPIPNFDPHFDPKLNGLVEAALIAADLSKGLVLVGYPASKEQGDYLVSLREALGLPKALVIHLVVPDEVARKRLKKDKIPDIEQRLQNYHRELDFARSYFPQTEIREINGNRKPARIEHDIRKLLPD
jgi:adenylate kinase family enzyme